MTMTQPQATVAPVARVAPEAGTTASIMQYDQVPRGEREFVVNLVNEGPRDFRMRYLTQVYEIPVGAATIVPWEVMVSFLGDPYAFDTPRVKERENVFRKISMKYGVYDDAMLWEQQKPCLVAYSVTSGERIWTVADDPTGQNYANQQTAANGMNAPLEMQLQHMQQTIEVLQRQVAAQTGAQVVEAPVGTPPSPGSPGPVGTSTGAGPAVTPPAPGSAQPVQPQAPVAVAGETSGVFTAPPAVFDAPPANAIPLAPADDAVQGATADEPGQPAVSQ